MCDCQSLTTPYKYLSLIGPPDISIRIYQPYLVSSEKSPQEVSIDLIKKNQKCKPGGVSNEPVLNSGILVTGFTDIYILSDFSLKSNFKVSRDTGLYHNYGY